MAAPPRLLTIAGSDSGGGAGIQADLKTFAAHGVYGMSVVTAVTAQNTVSVRRVELLSPELVAEQIDAVLEDIGVDVVKVGMLGSAELVAVVAERLAAYPPRPLVLDPVMVAKSGASLLDDEGVEVLRARLLPLATLVTPNLPEAARLTGLPVGDEAERRAAARALGEVASAALVKGGHGDEIARSGDEREAGGKAGGAKDVVVDVLFDGERFHRFEWPRIRTRSTHGTGCTLSAAIAANLGRGLPLERAVAEAGRYLNAALRTAYPLGHGHGPVNHACRFLAPLSE